MGAELTNIELGDTLAVPVESEGFNGIIEGFVNGEAVIDEVNSVTHREIKDAIYGVIFHGRNSLFSEFWA